MRAKCEQIQNELKDSKLQLTNQEQRFKLEKERMNGSIEELKKEIG